MFLEDEDEAEVSVRLTSAGVAVNGLLVQLVHHCLQDLPGCREAWVQAGKPIRPETLESLVAGAADNHFQSGQS